MYPGNGRVSSKGLEITSNIVCGTSIIALMLVIYAMIRKIRDVKGPPTIWSRRSKQPILITHLAIALIMKMTSIMTLSIFDETTVITTNDIDYKCTTDGIILATMVQFAQLASICWMSCQAIDHYVKITRVAEGILEYPRSFMNRLVLLGWGLPSVTILLILILYYNEVEVFVDLSLTAGERICWVNSETLYICWVIPFACFFILVSCYQFISASYGVKLRMFTYLEKSCLRLYKFAEQAVDSKEATLADFAEHCKSE